MTAEAIAAPTTVASARPYAPSWLDILYDWIERLPGPSILTYVAMIVPSIALTNSALWLSDLLPLGKIEPVQAAWAVATVAILAAPHRLRQIAGAAFDTFRPALGTGVSDPERARYELTVMPARWILGLTGFSFVITPLYYVADPVASGIVGHTPIGLVPRLVSEALTSTILLAILYQAVRQIRTVSRLHEAAEGVDPFRPSPLYAFSRLTAQVGFVLIGFNSLGLVLNPVMFDSAAGLALYLPWLLAFTLVAVVVFVFPLLGMHRRLGAVKDRLQEAADGRMRDLIGELNEAIDARATDRVEALDRTISALRHERELLARLPTWPWSGGTIRGFGSALLLPLAVFLLQRLLAPLLPA